jgi:hypothetical protein
VSGTALAAGAKDPEPVAIAIPLTCFFAHPKSPIMPKPAMRLNQGEDKILEAAFPHRIPLHTNYGIAHPE